MILLLATALLLSDADIAAIRKLAPDHPSAVAIRKEADKALRRGPWSVTYSRPKDTPAGPNDFYSDGPYWWPDPKNPGGPYIRKDGETNPDRFVDNDRDQNEMCNNAATLGIAAWLFNEPKYNERLRVVLNTWFLDPKTRMMPHMEYGQAVRGRNFGRGAGLIETRPFIWLIQGVLLAETAPGWDPHVGNGLRQWFAEYLRWFTTDDKGKQEMKAGNNHSTWWAAQVASFAILTRDQKTQQQMWTLYGDYLVTQFQSDGSAPREESRTRSLSYSAMNLDAFALLCRMAEVQGVNGLWKHIDKPVAYLAPYVTGEKQWTQPQIRPFQPDRTYFLALAGIGLGNPKYIDAQRRAGLTGGSHAELLNLLMATRQAP